MQGPLLVRPADIQVLKKILEAIICGIWRKF